LPVATFSDEIPSVDELAERLHNWIHDLDPSRWSSIALDSARFQLTRLRGDMERRMAAWAASPAAGRAEERLRDAWKDLLLAMPDPSRIGDARAEWSEIHAMLTPRYEALATALREHGRRVQHLRPTNFARSGFHLSMGLGVALAFETILTPRTALYVAIAWCVWSWSLEITRRIFPSWNEILMRVFGPIARHHERYRVNSATWFGTGLLVIAFTSPNIAGILGVLAVGVGDPIAGYVGRKFGRTKIVHGRSLEGSLGFAAASFLTGLFWIHTFHTELSMDIGAVLAGTAAIVGAVVELTARRIDDNFAIPVFAGWATAVVHSLLT